MGKFLRRREARWLAAIIAYRQLTHLALTVIATKWERDRSRG
jgi:hypothetical protein